MNKGYYFPLYEGVNEDWRKHWNKSKLCQLCGFVMCDKYLEITFDFNHDDKFTCEEIYFVTICDECHDNHKSICLKTNKLIEEKKNFIYYPGVVPYSLSKVGLFICD